VNTAPFAHPQAQSIVVILLVAVWSAMAVLARRSLVKPVPPQVLRVSLTMTAALTGALLACIVWSRPQPVRSDLAPVWASARALLHQQDPYEAVGPGRAYDTVFPQIYPMTSIVTAAPLALLPLRWADALFVGLGFGLFTWAATSRRLMTPALVALVSLPALMTLQTSQWSLLLTGAALMPVCGWLLIAKPTIGLALFAAYPRWKTAVGCAALLALSFLILPGWLPEWRATLASAPHVVAPITRPGGLLVLLALLKWKRAEARLLVALACVPHTTAPYETIPLFLIPATWLQAWGLWACAVLAYVAQWATGPYGSQAEYWASGARWIVALIYLPCLVMVLRRPNVWSEDDLAAKMPNWTLLTTLWPHRSASRAS
jgi:hypothetical protein